MKKIAFILLILLAIPVVKVSAQDHFQRISINDQIVNFHDDEIQKYAGEIMVPAEKMGNYLNAEALISSQGDHFHLIKDGIRITYSKSKNRTTVNDKVAPNSPMRLIQGVPYISITFIGKTFGYDVKYIPKTKITNVSKKGDSKKGEPKQPANQPTVYLTFDDGPNEFTVRNMETMKSNGVKGTFFFVGKQINLHPDIVKAAANDGHSIGVHSMTHDRSKVYASSKAFIGEMNSAKNLIKVLTGSSPTITRAPYGSKPNVTKEMRNELVGASYKLWDWDVDSNDWKYSVDEYKKIIANVKEGVRKSRANDQHIVVLLHDRAQTAKALPEIIAWLKAEGFNIEPYDPSRHVVQNFLKDNDL